MDNDLPRSFDCILRTLTSKCSVEVAFQLMDIFLLLEAPSILQSDNGSEFTVQVITELKNCCCRIKPRHPYSQGSVERANCDAKFMLVAWLADNDATGWTVGLK